MNWDDPDSKLTVEQAVEILNRIVDKDDPYWDSIVEDYYDEETDTWPGWQDVLRPFQELQAENTVLKLGTKFHKLKVKELALANLQLDKANTVIQELQNELKSYRELDD